MQLDLFAWQIEQSGRGLQKLLALQFDDATAIFRELLKSYPNDKEVMKGNITALYWGNVFEQCGNFASSDEVEYLHLEIKGFDYSKSPSPDLFKNALLNKLCALMREKDLFYINGEDELGSILIELQEYDKARESIALQVAKDPGTSYTHLQLADVLWLLGERKEAAKNYAIGMLCRPDEIFQYPVECNDLAEMLRGKPDPCTALCCCYMKGNFNTHDLRGSGIEPSGNETTTMEWQAYHALFDAERARKSPDQNPMEHRRKLKELHPALYKEYFKWLERIQKPLQL